tara:strand:- start:455 stop:880 length:426 start_codon:yes stop_codon:yes gene_type:complete
MIKYNLICKSCNNNFDSWFSSSDEYEKIVKINLLNCNLCNSTDVEKSLMAPNLKNTKKMFSQQKISKQKKIKKIITNYQKFIKNNFNYVGDNFGYEARSIHYNIKESSKGIYGNASKKEIQDLNDEGIKTEIIPWFPENEN